MVSDEGMFFSFDSFHLILFPLPPTLVIQLAEVLLTKVCECVNTVAVEMSSSVCICVRMYIRTPFFPPLLSFLAFFHLLAFACFSQS